MSKKRENSEAALAAKYAELAFLSSRLWLDSAKIQPKCPCSDWEQRSSAWKLIVWQCCITAPVETLLGLTHKGFLTVFGPCVWNDGNNGAFCINGTIRSFDLVFYSRSWSCRISHATSFN
jgi:hypothetical protein